MQDNIFSIEKIAYKTTLNSTYHEITSKQIPISFWRSNSKIFPIVESHVFPMVSFGANGMISNLGKAWITWTIQIEDKKIAAWAIYDRGKVTNFTLVDGYYDEIYWNSVQQELFIITSTKTETQFFWHSTANKPLVSYYSMGFNSTNHNILVSENKFLIFLYQNGSIPTNIEITGFFPELTITQEILISSGLGMGLFQLADNSIELRTDFERIIIPDGFTNHSIVGHSMLEPAVYDPYSGKVWINNILNEVTDLPNNSVSIFPYGLKSSIVLTTSNELYELSPNGWEIIDTINPKYIINDYALIDIDLYVGTNPENGLRLFVSGLDVDGDFIPDTMEDYYFTLPESTDSDNDSIPDGLEIAFGTDPLFDDRLLDYDEDKLNNINEFIAKTDPKNQDSDYGGAIDGWEITYELDPLDPEDDLLDFDRDGVPNNLESIWDSDPRDNDTDDDDMPDGWEIKYKLDPTDGKNAILDPDADGKSNLQEYLKGTDPLVPEPRKIFEGLYWWFTILFAIFAPLTLFILIKLLPDNKI